MGFMASAVRAFPPAHLQVYEREYPFAWLGILANAAPASDELVYSLNDRGFALFSMRSATVTRLYLQCAPDEDLDDWSDDRIWAELIARLRTTDGWQPNVGPICRRGSRRCEASSSSRCATADCFSLATRRTSSRRPERRA